MRYTSVLLLALALTGSLPVGAQSPSPAALQPALQHGIDQVTLHLTLLHPLPGGARYQCRVTAAAPNLLPGESVTALAVVTGNHATCVLPMPLAWFPANPIASAMPAPELRFTITAYPAPDAPAAPLRRIALPAIAVALPQPDGVRAVDLPLAF